MGISGGFLGFVLGSAGVSFNEWQFWAVFGIAGIQYGVGGLARSNDK